MSLRNEQEQLELLKENFAALTIATSWLQPMRIAWAKTNEYAEDLHNAGRAEVKTVREQLGASRQEDAEDVQRYLGALLKGIEDDEKQARYLNHLKKSSLPVSTLNLLTVCLKYRAEVDPEDFRRGVNILQIELEVALLRIGSYLDEMGVLEEAYEVLKLRLEQDGIDAEKCRRHIEACRENYRRIKNMYS